MFEGFHCKVEPDLDLINTDAALDPLLDKWSCAGHSMRRRYWHEAPDQQVEKTSRKRNIELEYKVRFVGREHRWQEFREDLFAPGASHCAGRIVDILSAYFHSGLHGCFSSGS